MAFVFFGGLLVVGIVLLVVSVRVLWFLVGHGFMEGFRDEPEAGGEPEDAGEGPGSDWGVAPSDGGGVHLESLGGPNPPGLDTACEVSLGHPVDDGSDTTQALSSGAGGWGLLSHSGDPAETPQEDSLYQPLEPDDELLSDQGVVKPAPERLTPCSSEVAVRHPDSDEDVVLAGDSLPDLDENIGRMAGGFQEGDDSDGSDSKDPDDEEVADDEFDFRSSSRPAVVPDGPPSDGGFEDSGDSLASSDFRTGPPVGPMMSNTSTKPIVFEVPNSGGEAQRTDRPHAPTWREIGLGGGFTSGSAPQASHSGRIGFPSDQDGERESLTAPTDPAGPPESNDDKNEDENE